jgi:ferredoxin
MAEDGYAEVYQDVEAENKETAEEARDNCPVSVIDLKEDD